MLREGVSPLAPCAARSSQRHALQSFLRHSRTRLQSTQAGSRTAARDLASASPESITWPEYLDIRGNKRKWEMATTVPCTILGFAGALMYFGNLETDPTKPIMGIDPMFFYGFSTVGVAGLGYLMGPVLGSTCWRLTHRKSMQLFEARDKEFYRHIVRNRVDPTRQSTVNPVPDYYGEKIGSLYQYRQWLRDQAKYRRKARWAAESELDGAQ